MDNPPVNYNPNDSLLNGGTDSSITKVMGGGGGGIYSPEESMLNGGTENITKVMGGGSDSVPNGYNENQSLLDITGGNSITIQMVKGGGKDDVMIIKEYNNADPEELNKLLKKDVSKAIPILERKRDTLDTKFKNSFLKYKIEDNELITTASNSRNISSTKRVVFVPLKIKTIIVLPHIENATRFLNILDFLLNSDYITVEKNELKIKRDIFIVSLKLDIEKDKNLYYLYLHLKVSNFESFFVVDEPYTIIYPKDKGILFSNTNLPKPETGALGIDIEEIQRYGIKKMAYKTGEGFYTTLDIISSGDEDPSSTPSGYTFTLKNAIAILPLKDEDIKTINVDILGRKFRVRLPLSSDRTKDTVYRNWEEEHYNKDEKELINYLGLTKFENLNIPEFLFYLTYYKCFDDVSLLTKQECSNLRANFERIYMNILAQYDIDTEDETINIVDFECNAVTMDDGNIICSVKYPKAGQYELAKINVEIDGSNINLVTDAFGDKKNKESKDKLKPIIKKAIENKRFRV